MGDLTVGFNDYGEFKATLGAELKANVEGFVRIGYLLKVARDTDILKESGHRNVAEFAAKEYGLTKDVVSRYIAINDRYSEGGYSDRLLAKFEGFGVSKLAEMLTLPDSIIDEITPTLTREEIKAIKAEVKAEEEISPIEIAIEAGAPENLKEERELSLDLRVWKAYFSGDNGKEKERFLDLDCAYYSNLVINDADEKEAKTKFFDTFGGKILWARVPGVGRIMIAVSEEADDKITFTNSRSGEKKTFTGKDVIADIKELVEGDGCVEDVFNDLFVTVPKEELKVAPVQQAAEDIMPKPGSWTYDQPKTKSVQSELENQSEAKSVQTEVNKSQGDADNEKECSKEPADGRSESNEDGKVSEGTENGGDKTENERDKTEVLGKLEVGDRIVSLKDGTRGTMLGYCAGEYKISTENGLVLVNEKSTAWKKEEVVDAEYREAKEGDTENDRSRELGTETDGSREEGSSTQRDGNGEPETDNTISLKTEQAGTEDTGLADKEYLYTKVHTVKDAAESIALVCSELFNNDYGSIDIVKSLEKAAKWAEKITREIKEYLESRKGVADGND